MLQEMRGEAVAQSVRRDAVESGARSMTFNHRPGDIAVERRAQTVEEEVRVMRFTGTRAHADV